MKTNNNMIVCRLDEEQHKRTCGYWYTVTEGSMSHTAFFFRRHFDNWLAERGLSLSEELKDDKWNWVRIDGQYRQKMHMDASEFEKIEGQRSRTLSNGEYVVAILEKGADGIVTVHTLNPNVRSRQTFDYRESREMVG